MARDGFIYETVCMKEGHDLFVLALNLTPNASALCKRLRAVQRRAGSPDPDHR